MTGVEQPAEEAFDQVQRQDMESFRDFDTKRFLAVHDPGAVSVFGNGGVAFGIDEIRASLERHFTRKEARWEWTELSRQVDPGRTAIIVYETAYLEPSSGFRQRAITSVAYTYRDGTWRAVLDQSTPLEDSSPGT